MFSRRESSRDLLFRNLKNEREVQGAKAAFFPFAELSRSPLLYQ